MEPRPGRNVQNAGLAARLQYVDEEAALALRALLPIDQLVPFVDETADIFRSVFARFANGGGVGTIILAVVGCEDPTLGLCAHRLPHRFGAEQQAITD